VIPIQHYETTDIFLGAYLLSSGGDLRISRTPAVYPSARSIALFADCRIRKG